MALQITSGDPGEEKKTPWVSILYPQRGIQKPPAKLGPNGCAYCKREGYWERRYPDCPQMGKTQAKPSFFQFLVTGEEYWHGLGTSQLAPQPYGPKEPWVTLDRVGEPIEFLLDTRATFSVLTTQKGPLCKRQCNVKAVSGKGNTRKFLSLWSVEIGSKNFKTLLV